MLPVIGEDSGIGQRVHGVGPVVIRIVVVPGLESPGIYLVGDMTLPVIAHAAPVAQCIFDGHLATLAVKIIGGPPAEWVLLNAAPARYHEESPRIAGRILLGHDHARGIVGVGGRGLRERIDDPPHPAVAVIGIGPCLALRIREARQVHGGVAIGNASLRGIRHGDQLGRA